VHELLLPRLSGRWILLIDGRSGSGKSTFAGWLAARTGASVLAMEDLYQGWGGLDAAAELLATRILPALAAGRAAEWRTWDWAADRPGPSRWTVPDGPLIVEGCGALTRASRRWASAAVVLDVQDAVRHARIRRRDPEDALPGHRRWAVQERRQQVRELPQALADVVARGGVRLPEGGQDMRSAVGASVEG
jgi:dephospho-CoA kinase